MNIENIVLSNLIYNSEFTKNRTFNERKSKNRIKSASQIGKLVPPPV
jgi:hypothetical protein